MKTRNIVLSGLFIAFGLLLPMIFHQFSMGGPAFLPMHIPVLIGGMLLGPVSGLLIGMVTPVLSSVLTGMPPTFPMLPIMFFELAVYGLVAGYLYKTLNLNIIISLILAMIGGRIVAGLVVYVLAMFFGFQGPGPIPFIQGAILTGLPGIAIQLVLVPIVVSLVRRNTNL